MNTHTIKKNSSKNTSFPRRRESGGFTLIETLVAIFILLISTTAPLSFAQSGLRASFLARDQIVAFYLSQEAIETIKNVRDNNSMSVAPNLKVWNDFDVCTAPAIGSFTTCNLDVLAGGVSFTVNGCSNTTGCPPMYYNSDTKRFTTTSRGNSKSKYTRTIYTTKLNDHEVQILVEVKWDSNFFGEKRIVAQENIFDWISTNN